MKFFADSILVALIVAIFIMVFSNFLLFFPWYLTLIYQTYNLSMQAAGENVVSEMMVTDVKNDLKERPIFKRRPDAISVYMDDVMAQNGNAFDKKQRGESFTVGLEAEFPFEIKFGDTTNFIKEVTVRYDVPTTGLRYYKDG